MNKTLIIAEIGWNHMGNMKIAKKMIIQAKKSGADIAKFQYWSPRNLKPGPWDNDGRRQIYEKAQLNEDKIKLLRNICKKNKINFLISVFNREDAQFIHNLGIRDIKIPSHECGNLKLIEFSAKKFKKVYFSTGASKKGEINKAINLFKKFKTNCVIMHCVSSYPCEVNKINLSRILWLKNFNYGNLGISDHTNNLIIPALSVMLGVSVVEKHFTIDNNLPGRDNKFAILPNQFLEMVKNIRDAEKSLINYGNFYQKGEIDIINNYRGRWG